MHRLLGSGDRSFGVALEVTHGAVSALGVPEAGIDLDLPVVVGDLGLGELVQLLELLHGELDSTRQLRAAWLRSRAVPGAEGEEGEVQHRG